MISGSKDLLRNLMHVDRTVICCHLVDIRCLQQRGFGAKLDSDLPTLAKPNRTLNTLQVLHAAHAAIMPGQARASSTGFHWDEGALRHSLCLAGTWFAVWR